MQRPIAVTLGEPAGIGPDIALSVWSERRTRQPPPFYIIGDPEFLARRALRLGLDVSLAVIEPEQAADAMPTHLPVVPLDLPVTAEPGIPDASSAPAAISAIERAVADVVSNRAGAVVTNPVSKIVLYQGGFVDPGHTEFLARLSQRLTRAIAHPVMMLWSPDLAVVPVTIHIPLREVASRLTSDLILGTARTVASDLSNRFGIAHPRLVAAGLNPHAGEEGTLGREDRDVIAPAIAQARQEGIDIRGPLPADTMFHESARSTYDAALCMYHDQALIPIKTLAFDHAVNVTLGLPFVRTSPDHGTAFDIAGTGTADPSSFAAALALAARLARAGAAVEPA